jgi:alpha-beta hydrolase superfamily lysophospholipase
MNTECQSIAFEREDASVLQVYCSLPETDRFPILIVCQGSQYQSVVNLHQEFLPKARNLGMALISVEKRGFYPDYFNEEEYAEYNCFAQRIADYNLIIKQLQDGYLEHWDRRIVVLGGSEGGVIAGALSSNIPEIIATMLFSSGGGLSFADELLLNVKKLQPEQFVDQAVAKLKEQFDAMIADPDPHKIFQGYTYKYWASFLYNMECHNALLKATMPIYCVHGIEDTMTPIESADALANVFQTSGKSNLTYTRIPGYGHDLKKPPRNIIEEAFVWLKNILDGKTHVNN